MTTQGYSGPELFTFHNAIFPIGECVNADVFFKEVCAEFDNKKIEQDPQGNVYVTVPGGPGSSCQHGELLSQLHDWNEQNEQGHVLGYGACFIFPDGSKRCPNCSWFATKKLKGLTRKQLRDFLKIVPEFVAEIKSPFDRYSDMQARMEVFRRNGVILAWLIHPDERTVAVYRQGSTEILEQPETMVAGPPLTGFVLDLEPIWKGLDFWPAHFTRRKARHQETERLK